MVAKRLHHHRRREATSGGGGFLRAVQRISRSMKASCSATAVTRHQREGSPARLAKRFGLERIFLLAAAVDRTRHEAWLQWIDTDRHESGNTGIYFPEAERLSRRTQRAHDIGNALFHANPHLRNLL